MFRLLLSGLLWLQLPVITQAQSTLNLDAPRDTDINPLEKVQFQAEELTLDSGLMRGHLGLSLRTKDGFHPYLDQVQFRLPPGVSAEIKQRPPTQRLVDPVLGKEVEVYDSGNFELSIQSLEPWTATTLPLSIEFSACSQSICLFPAVQSLKLRVRVGELAQTPPTALTEAAPELPKAPPPEPSKEATRGWLFWLVLFAGGLATNLTPCVIPLIPITLKILSRQGKKPWLGSFSYALGIIISYTVLGFIVGRSGALFGAIAASNQVNIALALMMFIFGISMVGFADFGFVQNLGQKLGAGKASVGNAFMMGTGAGLVASPCTGPILGLILTEAAKSPNPYDSALQLLVYSTGFGLPYALLGRGAHTASKLKVSPSIQLGVKLLFSAVMFSLSIYYLRIPLYQYFSLWAGYWASLALGFGSFGLGLAALIISNRALAMKKLLFLLPSLSLGAGLFSVYQWQSVKSEALSTLKWIYSEADGLRLAAETRKPILIDGWAEWCEACKKMDRTTYLDPEVQAELNTNWIIVKLDLTEITSANEALIEKYGLQGLPTMVLMSPDGDLSTSVRHMGYLDGPSLLAKLNAFGGEP